MIENHQIIWDPS